MYKADRSRKETWSITASACRRRSTNRPLKFEEFEGLMPQTVCVSATPASTGRAWPARWSSRWCGPTGLVDPQIEVRPASAQVDDSDVGSEKRIALGERVW